MYPADNARSTPRHASAPGDGGRHSYPLLVLMASAVIRLLITCRKPGGDDAVSRVIPRLKDFAMRTALGAPRSRLVRKLLTESTVLAVAGGVTGVLLATLPSSGSRSGEPRVTRLRRSLARLERHADQRGSRDRTVSCLVRQH